MHCLFVYIYVYIYIYIFFFNIYIKVSKTKQSKSLGKEKKLVFWTSSETILDVLCIFTISFCFSVAIFRANTFVLARGVSRSETIISRYSSRVTLLRGTFHFDFGEVFRRSHESSFFYDLFVDF